MLLYHLSVAVHLLAALVWLGGMFFLALVGAPVLRTVEPAALRQRLFDALGRRFRGVGWIALAILFVTGTTNLHHRGLLSPSLWVDPRFVRSAFGTALWIKFIALGVMLAVEGYHDWVIGPRAGSLDASSAEAAMLRKRASIYARISALAGVVIVLAAVRLARP